MGKFPGTGVLQTGICSTSAPFLLPLPLPHPPFFSIQFLLPSPVFSPQLPWFSGPLLALLCRQAPYHILHCNACSSCPHYYREGHQVVKKAFTEVCPFGCHSSQAVRKQLRSRNLFWCPMLLSLFPAGKRGRERAGDWLLGRPTLSARQSSIEGRPYASTGCASAAGGHRFKLY